MADKISDNEDRILQSMFRSEVMDDGGFSKTVIARIRRRLWINRLALPVATLIGGVIAFQPAVELLRAIPTLLNLIPANVLSAPLQLLPQLQLVVMGGMLLAVGLVFLNALAE